MTKKRWWFRVAAVVIGLLLGVLVAELALRVSGFEPTRLRNKLLVLPKGATKRPGYHCYFNGKKTDLKPFAHENAEDWKIIGGGSRSFDEVRRSASCVSYELNEDGLRDGDHTPGHAPGVSRIIVMGDSFVLGEGVPREGTLVHQLSGLLGPRYELFNAGISGSDTKDEVRRLPELCTKYGAKRAIHVFIANDIGMSEALAQRQSRINDMINVREENVRDARERSWFWRLRVVQLVAGNYQLRKARRATINWYRDLYNPTLNPHGVRQFLRDLDTLSKKPGGCEVAFVIYPLMDGLEDYELTSVHNGVADAARGANIPVLDLLPAFAGKNSESLQVDPSDHHPNTRAHRLAANAIVDWLQRDHPEFLAQSPAGPAQPGAPADASAPAPAGPAGGSAAQRPPAANGRPAPTAVPTPATPAGVGSATR